MRYPGRECGGERRRKESRNGVRGAPVKVSEEDTDGARLQKGLKSRSCDLTRAGAIEEQPALCLGPSGGWKGQEEVAAG